jgi:hypothetical protein
VACHPGSNFVVLFLDNRLEGLASIILI